MHNDRVCSTSIESVRKTVNAIATRDGWSYDISGAAADLAEIGAYETESGELAIDDPVLGRQFVHQQVQS